MTTTPIRLLMVDDQPLRQVGLRPLLEAQPDLTVVGAATDPSAVVALLRQTTPDVLLMPLRVPATSALDALPQLRHEHPATRILLLGASADPAVVLAALAAGATGYLREEASAADLLTAVHLVAGGQLFVDPTLVGALLQEGVRRQRLERPHDLPAAGRAPLSAREREVVHHVQQGLTNPEIAAELGIGEKTVKTHLRSVFRKWHLRRRIDLLLLLPPA